MKNKLKEIKDIIEKWESKCDETDNKNLHSLDYETLCEIKRSLE